jgi:preprotein translocase subunit YajC
VFTLLVSFSDWLLQPEVSTPGAAPSAPTGGGAIGAPGCEGGMSQMGLMLVMMVVLYLVMIRPQQKKQKEQDAMHAGLQKGNKVRTTGGIRGEIVDVRDDEVVVLIADRVKVNVLRTHVSGLIVNKESK